MEGMRNRETGTTEASGPATRWRAGVRRGFRARLGQVNDSIGNAESEAGLLRLSKRIAFVLAKLCPNSVRELLPTCSISAHQFGHEAGRVLIFSLALSLLTLLLFGLTPAITASRTNLDATLRGARSTNNWRGRRALIVCQIGLCTFLVTAAILLVRTFEHLRAVNPGFDSEHVATFTADTTAAGYSPKAEATFLQLLTERAREIRGVVSVAIASVGVMRQHGLAATVAPTGQRATRADFLNSDLNAVTPEYFDTMGIRLLFGRLLTSADSVSRPDLENSHGKRVKAVVNQAFAQHFFPNTNAVGKFFGNSLETVVGLLHKVFDDYVTVRGKEGVCGRHRPLESRGLVGEARSPSTWCSAANTVALSTARRRDVNKTCLFTFRRTRNHSMQIFCCSGFALSTSNDVISLYGGSFVQQRSARPRHGWQNSAHLRQGFDVSRSA